MSLQHAAKYLAQHGRGKDTMLVHMTPREVGGLQALARANGGTLSVNPDTGLPEAGFLDSMMPMLIGAGLAAATGGTSLALTPGMIGLGVGAIEGLRTGDLGKGITAGLGAYGGAGLAGGLMGAGASSLASQNAGAAFNPATMATTGEGAMLGTTPNVMGMEQLQAAHPEATMAELDAAQQAQKSALDTWEAQQNAMRSAPQAIEAPASSAMDKIKAGLGATTSSPSAGLNFLKDNAKYAMAAASPLAAGLGEMPEYKGSGPNPYRYRFERGEASPFPTASRTGIEQSYFPNMRYVPYAGGGAVEAMSDANAIGANTGFPMADIQRGAYATPYQQPISQNVVTGAQDTRVDSYTGTERLAEGGTAKENPLLASPYRQEYLNENGAGANSAPGSISSGPGQGISGIATGLGLGMMGLGEALGPGIASGVIGALGSGIAGSQADAMGNAMSALSDIAAQSESTPGVVSMSDSQGNVVSVSSPASISAADIAMGLADAVAAASTSASSSSSAGVGGGTGSGSDGGTGDAGTATGDGGASGGDGGGGEANGGLLRRKYAMGGLSDLGGYSDGGRLLRGPGDGVSDSIPAVIGKRQPARLADGEFVVPARIVSELGNGSTEAGARKLYAMLDRVQKARGKTVGKGKVAKNTRADKYLPA